MLIYNKGALAFLHVPKNGGKSIRASLDARFTLELGATAADLGISEEELAAGYAGGDGIAHPVLGKVKLEHLPLHFWHEHFPQSFAAFRTARSLVLLRDPRDRFFSAILQRLGEYHDMKALRADDPIVTEEALRVSEWLAARDAFSDMEYIHFTRQADYVELDGERLVTALFPLEDITAAEAWIAEAMGETVQVSHDHARREPKAWAKPIQPIVRFVGRNLIPAAIKRTIYPLWRSSGAFEDASRRYKTISLDPQVEAFIDSYYARDGELLAQARGAVSAGVGS